MIISLALHILEIVLHIQCGKLDGQPNQVMQYFIQV